MRGFGLVPQLLLLPILVFAAVESDAGEAYIKKARGNKLVIEQGAEAGLEVGMEVTIVRPPGDAVIHPVSGENLGAPEIKVGTGQVTKTSARAATIVVSQALLNIQPGDMVRFTTVEEELILDEEVQRQRREQAQKERRQIQGDLSKLTQSIKRTQGTIKDLRNAIKRLDRIDENIKGQLRIINDDIHGMKEEIKGLKETVNLMGVVPVGAEGEIKDGLITEENREVLEEFIRGVMQEEMPEPWEREAGDPSVDDLAEEDDPDFADSEPLEEESSWWDIFEDKFWYVVVGVVGVLLLIAMALYYLKMKSDAEKEDDEDDDEDDDDEEEEEEDEEEEDDEEDFDVEDEEEDDIVVEDQR